MEKDLNYWKKNAEEDYMKVSISVLRYITELEKVVLPQADVTPSNLTLKVTNCRGIAKLQDIANGIGKDRVINIQKMYPDDDIYFLYYWG